MIKSSSIVCIFMMCLFLSSCDLCKLDGSCKDPVSYVPDYTHPAATVLNVSLSRQQSEVWCWAATIEMVSSYYGNGVAQCVTLSYWYNADCCTYARFCQTTGTEAQIQNSFSALGISSTYWRNPLTWDQSTGELNSGRPFILYYRGSFSGHVVVAFGYNSEKKTLFIHDPYYGSFEVPFGETLSYNGNMRWSQTLFGFQRM